MNATAGDLSALARERGATASPVVSMKKIVNHLIQLQELLEARAQHAALGGGERMGELEASIGGMLKELEPATAGVFVKLHQRGHTAIVPVVNGACTGCGMALPISQVHAVRAALQLHQCPNCSRFLFAPDRIAGKRPSVANAGRLPRAGIARFSSPRLMIPSLKADGRDDALAEICRVIEAEGFAEQGATLVEHALRREAILPTALDNGIAFPHVRGVEGGGLTLALALKPRGFRFDPGTRGLTRIVFFVIIPAAASAFYLKLLAGLTKTFSVAENRQKLFDADSPDALWRTLCQCTRRAIP